MAGSCSDEILQNRNVEVHGSDTSTLHGESTTIVHGPRVVRVDAQHTLLIGEGRDDGQAEVAVSQKYLLSSGGTIRVNAQDSIVLTCGDSSIELTPKGVSIKSKGIELIGSESTLLSGPGPAMRLADDAQIVSKSLKLYSESASIELDKNASVKGTQVLLNCDGGQPDSDDADVEKPETQPFALKLTDERYAPYGDKKYKMVCEGKAFDGTTDGDGSIEVDVPKGAKSAQITLWLGDFPTGPVKRYSVAIEDLPDVGSVAGAQIRLKNLGYYKGAGRGEIDDETRAAISSLQRDHDISTSGEVDEPTKAALLERHGS